MEIWKDIKHYEGLYQVSNLGRVKRLKGRVLFKDGRSKIVKEKIKVLQTDINGYSIIMLYKNNKHENVKIHRLVGQTFIDNPFNKPHINHKNGIKKDNSVENLEWCTPSENMIHKINILKKTSCGQKIILDMQNGIFYESMTEADGLIGNFRGHVQNMIDPKNRCRNYYNLKIV